MKLKRNPLKQRVLLFKIAKCYTALRNTGEGKEQLFKIAEEANMGEKK